MPATGKKVTTPVGLGPSSQRGQHVEQGWLAAIRKKYEIKAIHSGMPM